MQKFAAAASTEIDCGKADNVCPNGTVELSCHTTGQVLIWNLMGIELDFSSKDSIGASESLHGITAELVGRNNGIQSKLVFRMTSFIKNNTVDCYDVFGSVASCHITHS